MTLQNQAIAYAARHAWIGFWHSCMSAAGGRSCLPFDQAAVAGMLNGHAAPEPEPKRQSQWATELEGDEGSSHITLGDVLLGLDDYFRIFRQLKKLNRSAYEYFSRVGAPLCFPNTHIRTYDMLVRGYQPVVNATDLPAYLGVFLARSKEEHRDIIINDTPAFLNFHLYEKRRKNIAVASPWKWTLYDHQEYSLDRDVLTKAERRRFPECGTWGFHYFIGIGLDGQVQALPMRMTRGQQLKSGDVIKHSRFVVPPGLKDMAGPKVTVHQYTAHMFSIVRAFCASALSGVQLSVRRDKEVARFGIPITYVRSFFRDRERVGARRGPLLHLVGEYTYQRGGREVKVGEHLRGARRFAWRGYDILLSAPGVHHAEPEALVQETLSDEDILPLPRNAVPLSEAAAFMQREIEASPRVPFRSGQPTVTYRRAAL